MRSLAEWLVLPLFLLPVGAAVGLGLWAREDYGRRIERVCDGGAEIARRWLAKPDGAASWIPDRAAATFAPGSPARGPEADYVPFLHPTGEGEVRLPASGLGREPWILTHDHPAGLGPEALADPAVRLEIEVGRRPVEIRGLDSASRILSTLLEGPDLERLRQAPLPASTKLFLVRRWSESDEGTPDLAEVERLLVTLCDLQRAGLGDGASLPAGAHRVGPHLAFSSGGAWPLLVLPESYVGLVPRHFAEGGGPDELVRLEWSFPHDPHVDGDVVWAGRLDTPLAGRWRFVAKYGRAWWKAPVVRRWAASFLALAAAFLALPVALLIAMRRRRRHEEARVRFLNELAHDLRTPLTSLRLHADLLARGTRTEERHDRYVSRVSREATRLSGLLANLLDLSRLERGGRSFESATVDVRDVVEQATQDFRATYPERAEDIDLEGPPDLRVLADPTALGRCVANLLDNAGKFTPTGTPIHVRWASAGSRIRLVVADEGPGIPAQEEQRVFARYARGRRAKTDEVPGTGLGLSLVRELVREMGGSVHLRPSAKGAVFEMRLRPA